MRTTPTNNQIANYQKIKIREMELWISAPVLLLCRSALQTVKILPIFDRMHNYRSNEQLYGAGGKYAGGRRAIESSWARQGVVDGNAGGAGQKTGEEWQWCGWCVRDCESKLEAILHSIGSGRNESGWRPDGHGLTRPEL